MEDNKIHGLPLPLEYLDLPDDELPLAQEDEVEAIAAVQDLDTPEGYVPLDDVDLALPVSEQPANDNMPVYGINLSKHEASRTRGLQFSPALITGLVATAFVLVCGLVFIPRILAAREPEPLLVTVKPIEVEEPKPEPGLTTNDILALIGALKYDTEDVSVAADRLSVGLRDGHLVVTQFLGKDETIEAEPLVTAAAKRSAALAAQLTDAHLAAVDGDEGILFTALTWIVQAQDGTNFLAISETPGELRAGSGITFLAGANGYTLSQSLYDALGGTDSGIAQSYGTMPVDLEGKNIETTAALPEPEPQPEEETLEETTDEAYYDEGYDDSDQEYYEEYSYEYDDTADTYADAGTYTAPTEPEPQPYVVPAPEEVTPPADDSTQDGGAEETPTEDAGA